MRCGSSFIVLCLVALKAESVGAAMEWRGFTLKNSAAKGSRRVFDGRHHATSCCSVLAFGRGPSSTKSTKIEETTAVDVAAVEDDAESREEGLTDGVDESAANVAAVGPPVTVDVPEPSPGFAKNILNTVKDFWIDAKTGTFALWSNFQTSQDIRKRVKGGHQLTYAEHTHLERGANDRRKLLQFVIIYAISPETFPYVVLYAPSLLPSTFEKKHAVLSKYNRLSQARASATLSGLSQLEQQIVDAKAKFKGKPTRPGTRQTKRVEALESQKEDTREILETGSKREAFERLREHMTAAAAEPGAKKKQKLPSAGSGLPGPAIKALGKGMGLAGWRGFAPGFYVKFRLNEHVKDLGKADSILRRVSVDSLSDSDLMEACNARAIDVEGGFGDPRVLRDCLREWLELTSADVAGRSVGPDQVFLPDRARLLGLGLNFLEHTRQGQEAELSRKALLNTW